MSRVKGVDTLQTSFERRTKEIESRFMEQFSCVLRLSLSMREIVTYMSRWQQFPQATARVSSSSSRPLRGLDQDRNRDSEAVASATAHEAARVGQLASESSPLRTSRHPFTYWHVLGQSTNQELTTQIDSLRQRASTAGVDAGSSAKLSVLHHRATASERQLVATKEQLEKAEKLLGEARTKVGIAEGKWEARLKELEQRLKLAEEKLKRERQGAKERVAELQATVKSVIFSFPLEGVTVLMVVMDNRNLEGQVAGARRRDVQLGDVLAETEANKQRQY